MQFENKVFHGTKNSRERYEMPENNTLQIQSQHYLTTSGKAIRYRKNNLQIWYTLHYNTVTYLEFMQIYAAWVNYGLLPKYCKYQYKWKTRKTSKMQYPTKLHNSNSSHGNFLRIQRLSSHLCHCTLYHSVTKTYLNEQVVSII